jgi:coenzyme F420-reducing hydrogenase delta subunit/ferredoxin
MSQTTKAVVKIDENYCGKCSICYSICPYEAIHKVEETGEVVLDIEKCQVCGICYSACPASAIEITYYDDKSLLDWIKATVKERNSHTLVLMCRGNTPHSCEIKEILEEKNIDVKDYIPLRVPCVGRISTEFLIGTFAQGIKRIVALPCEENFCRFKQGSKINTQRLLLTKNFLRQMGFEDNALIISSYVKKAVYDTEKCVGCDKCTFVCPYEAIEAEVLATPKINLEKCVGCGACALVCPHLAIQLQGFEFEKMSEIIKLYSEKARKLKTMGISPIILVFCCQWSEFSVLDNPENTIFDKKTVLLEVPCFKGLDPIHVIQALQTGFDGVLAVVCSPEDCKLEKGRETAERNMETLKRALENLQLQDRFEIYTNSPRHIGDFNQKLEKFRKKIITYPPLQILKTKNTSKENKNV